MSADSATPTVSVVGDKDSVDKHRAYDLRCSRCRTDRAFTDNNVVPVAEFDDPNIDWDASALGE